MAYNTSHIEQFYDSLCKKISQATNKKSWYKIIQHRSFDNMYVMVFIGGIPIKQPRFKTMAEECQHFISCGYEIQSLICNTLINAFELIIKSPSDYQYEKFIENFKLPNEKKKTKN